MRGQMEFWDLVSHRDSGEIELETGGVRRHALAEILAPLTCDVVRERNSVDEVFLPLQGVQDDVVHINVSAEKNQRAQ